ncbi:MAG: hypothetical protein HC842_08060 [Cytophagales bacterium]|nr:hypothetical protein [Cytophagales bacterium]
MPRPGACVVATGWAGMSSDRYWHLVVKDGIYGGSPVELAIVDEDLEVFAQAVVAEGRDSSMMYRGVSRRPYRSAGRSEVSGNVSNGRVSSRNGTLAESRYFAVGMEGSERVYGEYFLPTAFSPNARSDADRALRLFGYNLAPENFVFQIFNTWNQVVYESRDLQEAMEQGWSGINQTTGNQERAGIYSYVIKVTFENGESHQKTGTITLID